MAPNKSLLSKLASALKVARDDVESLRDRRLQILEQMEAIRNAPVTHEEIARRVDRALEQATHTARDWSNIAGLASPEPTRLDLGSAFRHEPLGTLCLLGLGDTMRASLIAQASASASGKPVDAAVRDAELEKLKGELEDAERAEESLLRDAEAAGTPIPRRRDADPAIYLAEEV